MDVNFVYSCSPCREDGNNTKAMCRCMNCHENFCRSCIQLHNKIFKSHTLVEKWDTQTGSADSKEGALPEVTCEQHPLELLKMFCENHDMVCCTVCIALDHRLCDKVHYIPNIAKEINFTKTKDETLQFMSETEKSLANLLCQKQEDMQHISEQRHTINKKVEDITNRLIARIKELQKEVLTNLETKYEKIMQDLKHDTTSLNASLDNLKVRKNKIENSDCMTKSQIFLQMKAGKSGSVKARKQYDNMKEIGTDSLDFEVNSDIESYLKEVESIGYINNQTKSEASLIGEFDIRLPSESQIQNIYGVCLLDNNEIVLADNSNLKLKRIDTEFQVLDTLELGATPYGICKTGHSEVALTLPWLHKIQFVSIGRKMVVNWAFKIDGICRGICCHGGYLYICCSGSGSNDPGHVIVSDMAGCLLRTFKTNKDGKSLFTSPQNLCFNEHDSYIQVADTEKGVVTVDQNGRFVSATSGSKLRDAVDVCVGDGAKIFLCGFNSNNVIQVDRYGKVVHEILNKNDLTARPLSVSFLRKPPRLLITSEGSSVVKVFKLD